MRVQQIVEVVRMVPMIYVTVRLFGKRGKLIRCAGGWLAKLSMNQYGH
jgi:hypothetical protein